MAKKKAPSKRQPAAAAEKAPAANPYEVFQNRRRRRAVLGERVRGEKRNLERSRAASAAERARSLIKDTLTERRSSSFRDARLGEQGGSGDGSSVQRLVKLRQRQAKRSFTLEKAGDAELTIAGRRLSDVADDELKADGVRSGDEDGGEYDPDAPLSEDPVERSKQQKAEAARERAEQEQQLEMLDSGFGDLMAELTFRPPKAQALKLDRDAPDGYDRLVKQLATDRKALASERLKTPEEVARERAERLEALERQRVERETADDAAGGPAEGEGSDDEQAVVGGIDGPAKTKRDEAAEEQDADDAEDMEAEEEDAAEEDGESESAEGSEEEDAGVEGKKDGGTKDDDDSEKEEGEEDDDDKIGEGCLPLLPVDEASAIDVMVNGAGEDDLPYSFSCPADSAAVAKLLQGRQPRTALKIVQRARACTTVALAPENRAKLKAFFGALLEHAIGVASRDDGDISARGAELLYALRPALVELASEYPDDAQEFFASRLKAMGPRTLPRARELFCLKLVTVLFPVTDFQHPVVTPAAMLADHWAAKLAALGAGLTDLVSDALLLWETLWAFLRPSMRFSCAFFQLGVALLESCWASAAGGRSECGGVADDVSKGIVFGLRTLADADASAARVAADELVRPALRNAVSSGAAWHAKAAELEANVCTACQADSTGGSNGDVGGGKPRLEPLRLFDAAPPQIRVLDPIFHEAGDCPGRGMELSETKKLRRKLNDERRAATRQLSRDAAALQMLNMRKDTQRRSAHSAERVRVRAIMEGETQMLAQLKTESGGGMDTSLGSYSSTKERKKANRRVGGNATDDNKPKRMGTPVDDRRRKRSTGGESGGASAAPGDGAPAPAKKKNKRGAK